MRGSAVGRHVRNPHLRATGDPSGKERTPQMLRSELVQELPTREDATVDLGGYVAVDVGGYRVDVERVDHQSGLETVVISLHPIRRRDALAGPREGGRGARGR